MTNPIAQRLQEAARALPAGPVSIQSRAQVHRPVAHGGLLLLMAAPCLLPVPGVGAVLGLGMAALAAAMWRGDAVQCLPRRVAEFDLSHQWAQGSCDCLRQPTPWPAVSPGHGAAISHWRGGRSRAAVAVGLMAIIAALPLPFGNVLPSLALMLIGLALVFRDGVAMLLGMTAAAFALAMTAGLAAMVWVWGGA